MNLNTYSTELYILLSGTKIQRKYYMIGHLIIPITSFNLIFLYTLQIYFDVTIQSMLLMKYPQVNNQKIFEVTPYQKPFFSNNHSKNHVIHNICVTLKQKAHKCYQTFFKIIILIYREYISCANIFEFHKCTLSKDIIYYESKNMASVKIYGVFDEFRNDISQHKQFMLSH